MLVPEGNRGEPMKARRPKPVAGDSRAGQKATPDWSPAKLSVEAAITAVENLDSHVRDLQGRHEVRDLLASCRLRLRSASRELIRAKEINDGIERPRK